MKWLKNVFTIFVSPVETFQRVKESKTAWIIPLAVVMLFSIVSVFLQLSLMEKDVVEKLLEQQTDPATMDAVIRISQISGIIMAFLMSAAGIFLMGLLLLLLNLVVRGSAKYMQLVTVAAFAALPTSINGLLTSLMLKFTDAQSLNDVSLSLGAFVTDKASLMYRILSFINPFGIWGIIMYVVGAAIMMGRPRKVVGKWIIGAWLIISVGSLLIL